jgi:hypothetical protein
VTTSGKTGAIEMTPHAGRPSDFLAGTVSSQADAGDPHNYMDAVRAYVEATWGVKAPSFAERISQAREAAKGPSPLNPPATSTDRYGLPAGDLTGDGLDDVMSLEITFNNGDFSLVGIALRGIRGTDASQLWSLDLSDLYDGIVLPAGDVTGDGAGDVLLVELYLDSGQPLGGCAFVACAIAGIFRYHWVVRIVSGDDGVQAWARTFNGESTEAFALAFGLVAIAEVEAVTATNAVVFPSLAADHDGDGAPDLVLNAYDVTQLFGFQDAGFVAGALLLENIAFFKTHAEVVKGTTGDPLMVRDTDYLPGGASLTPVGQAVGSATGDLLWQSAEDIALPLACVFAIVTVECAENEHSTVDVEMIDGSGFGSAWTSTIDDPDVRQAYLTPAGADLTGDARSDVLLLEFTESGLRQGVVSGANGVQAWIADIEGFLAPIGPAGGSAGDDLLSIEFGYDETTFAISVTLKRLDGGTGVPVLTTTHTYDPPDIGFVFVSVFLAGDGDGDGVGDAGISTESFDYETETLLTSSLVESGATGAAIYSIAAPTFETIFPAGDQNGDGSDDLLYLTASFYPGGITLTTKGVRLPAGTVAWTRNDPLLPSAFVLLFQTGDQSGLGGTDHVYSRFQFLDGYDESRVDGLEGMTGTLPWGFGDTLTPPPSPATGSISGTVIDEGSAPIEGVCVTAFTLAGDFAGATTTAADGTYSVGGLGTGSLAVLFDACAGGYVNEWYDNQTSFEDADPVPVTDGVDTPGVDATLTTLLPPDNDDIANAVIIPGLPYTDARSTIGATTESGEAEPCGFIGSTVWYKTAAAGTGLVDANTIGSGYDTVLAVYSGADPSSLVLEGCNDDAAGLQSDVTFLATAGQTYWFQVGGFSAESGPLQLSVAGVV